MNPKQPSRVQPHSLTVANKQGGPQKKRNACQLSEHGYRIETCIIWRGTCADRCKHDYNDSVDTPD